MMRGASGDEWGKLLGQEYNRPAEAGVLKKPRGSDFFTFLIISRSILLGMMNVSGINCRENKNHIWCSRTLFFSPKIVPWKDIVLPGRPQMTI
jgi:hypothetical protein